MKEDTIEKNRRIIRKVCEEYKYLIEDILDLKESVIRIKENLDKAIKYKLKGDELGSRVAIGLTEDKVKILISKLDILRSILIGRMEYFEEMKGKEG